MTAGNEAITDTKYEQLLGIKVDHELKFNEHVIWKKASAKINAVTRITFSVTFDQGRLIMGPFVTSHFSKCPIAWIFHIRKLNERINCIII